MSLKLQNEEVILKSSLGVYIPGGAMSAKNGALYLTNQRFIFAKHSTGKWILLLFLLGIIGLFILYFSKGTNIKYHVDLDKIKRLEPICRKNGAAYQYKIHTTDGAFNVQFTQDLALWPSYIRDAIRCKRTVTEQPDGGFIVE